MKANKDIREYAERNRIPLWRIADKYGCTDNSFSRKLRKELTDEDKQKIINIIDELTKEN